MKKRSVMMALGLVDDTDSMLEEMQEPQRHHPPAQETQAEARQRKRQEGILPHRRGIRRKARLRHPVTQSP